VLPFPFACFIFFTCYNTDMDKNMEKMQESIEMIAKTTAHILENMVTKEEVRAIVNDMIKEDLSDIKTELHDFRMDMKSFRKDTENFVKETEIALPGLNDTVMYHDKRIEKLENKVFA